MPQLCNAWRTLGTQTNMWQNMWPVMVYWLSGMSTRKENPKTIKATVANGPPLGREPVLTFSIDSGVKTLYRSRLELSAWICTLHNKPLDNIRSSYPSLMKIWIDDSLPQTTSSKKYCIGTRLQIVGNLAGIPSRRLPLINSIPYNPVCECVQFVVKWDKDDKEGITFAIMHTRLRLIGHGPRCQDLIAVYRE